MTVELIPGRNAETQIAVGNYNFGADGGSQGAFTIFTLTGDVLLTVFGICDVALLGATATIELGVSGNTAALIAQATATDLILNEIWHDATPSTTLEKVDLNAAQAIVAGGQNVTMTVATANLTAGDIDFYAIWRALSSDGAVVPA